MNSNNQITISQIPDILEAHNTPNAKPVLFEGLPGLGKSSAILEFCKKNNFDPFIFLLSQFSPPDFKGYLVPDKENRRMDCFPTNELPWSEDGRPYAETHDGRRPLIVLEELLQAMTSMFNLSQQLILDHRIGCNFLPPDVMIVSAANGVSMKCASNKLTMSLADRFAIYHIRPDFDSTISWMSENKVNRWIVSFLRAQHASGGGVLWSTTPDKWNGEEPLDSSRSYTALSHLLNKYTDDELRDLSILPIICQANIGEKSGIKLAEFIKLSIEAGDIEKMIKNPDKAKIPTRPDIRWGVAAQMVTYATAENFDNILKLAKRLTPDELRPENDEPTAFESFIIRSAMDIKPQILMKNKAWADWFIKNRQFINPGNPSIKR